MPIALTCLCNEGCVARAAGHRRVGFRFSDLLLSPPVKLASLGLVDPAVGAHVKHDNGIPQYSQLMWPTLVALRALGGSGTVTEIDAKVAELLGLTREQQAVLHGKGTQTEVGYRLAWARTHLRGVGAVVNANRGVWSITGMGQALGYRQMTERLRVYLARYQERRRLRRAAQDAP